MAGAAPAVDGETLPGLEQYAEPVPEPVPRTDRRARAGTRTHRAPATAAEPEPEPRVPPGRAATSSSGGVRPGRSCRGDRRCGARVCGCAQGRRRLDDGDHRRTGQDGLQRSNQRHDPRWLAIALTRDEYPGAPAAESGRRQPVPAAGTLVIGTADTPDASLLPKALLTALPGGAPQRQAVTLGGAQFDRYLAFNRQASTARCRSTRSRPRRRERCSRRASPAPPPRPSPAIASECSAHSG